MRRAAYLFVAVGFLVAIAVDAHAQAKAIRMPTAAGSERIFSILLPQSYETSKARYPVVYLFHGGGQDHTAFMARTAFPPMARKHEFIVVMPAADRNYSVLGPEAQGRYNDYVAGELVDYVDSHYRTIATKESRAIAAIRPDAEDAVRNVAAAAPFFYISCGTLDSLLPINREFVGWLMERDLPHDYKEAPGLGHTWALWDEQIGVFFDLLQSRGFKSAS